MIHFTTTFHGLELTVRDLEERDVGTIVDYWHQSTPEYLKSIGVDVRKLTSPEETRARILSSLAGPPAQRARAYFVVTGGGGMVGYTNLHLPTPHEGYAHVHVLQPGVRMKAVARFLFPAILRLFFASFPIRKVIFQTSPENGNVNRMLARSGLRPARVELAHPDGMARPGQFNVYEVPREACEAGLLLSAAEGEEADAATT
jgi:hypothetical protein